jgi:hypothetical protein
MNFDPHHLDRLETAASVQAARAERLMLVAMALEDAQAELEAERQSQTALEQLAAHLKQPKNRRYLGFYSAGDLLLEPTTNTVYEFNDTDFDPISEARAEQILANWRTQ